MKAVRFLLKNAGGSKKAGLAIGIALLALFIVASVYMTLFFELPLPAVGAALAALSFVYFRSKVYMLLMEEPLIFHIISLLAAAHMGVRFYGFADGTRFMMLFFSSLGGAVIFFIAEILFSNLIHFLSDGPHPENLLKAFAAVFPLLFTVFVYVPSETYFLNRNDLLFVFFDFAPYIFIKTAVFTLIGIVAYCAFSPKAFRVISALTVGLTLCVYCQYAFMNSGLPSTFGEPMDQSSLLAKKIVNAVIWILLLILPLIYAKLAGRSKALSGRPGLANGHLVLSSFLGAIQLGSLAVIVLTSQGSLSKHERYMLDSTEQFVVSGNKNVITFIVDEADRHYFDDVYAESPEEFDFLRDFTYYDNACMMYDSTYISIPQMLSGTTELPEYDLNYWVRETWSSEPCETFYSRLHEENYKVNVYGDFSYNYNPYRGKFDNCLFQSEDQIRVAYDKLYDSINGLAAYRYMPLFFKESIAKDVTELDRTIVYQNTCTTGNRLFLDATDLKLSESDSNYFIVQHIVGAHWQSGEELPQRIYTCLELLRKYITQLQELGVYEDSVIIITADHGSHNHADNFPIYYVKRAGDHGEKMKVNSAPIHHSDYLATCIDAAGLKKESDGSLFGRSIFDIPEDEQRERLVFQRYTFPYMGEVEFKRCVDDMHRGAAYGYYFTGNREDLVKREEAGPPDILIELKEKY
ncbi:MAG: hypothetical protein IKP95_12240 [Ruminococcus sp.]|nr:hypothetical protein [Ruminococcus sp.]